MCLKELKIISELSAGNVSTSLVLADPQPKRKKARNSKGGDTEEKTALQLAMETAASYWR